MDRQSVAWDRVTAISSALLVVTAVVALWFAYSQIQEARNEARIVHLQEMVRQFDEAPISNTLRSFALKRIDQKQEVLRPLDPSDAPDEMYDLMNYFEAMGLLVKRGYLNEEDVWDEFGFWLFNF